MPDATSDLGWADASSKCKLRASSGEESRSRYPVVVENVEQERA
jgi:hypothetical protein